MLVSRSLLFMPSIFLIFENLRLREMSAVVSPAPLRVHPIVDGTCSRTKSDQKEFDGRVFHGQDAYAKPRGSTTYTARAHEIVVWQ